jgi:ABC-type Fe3+ transport system permease subunit
MLQEAGWKACPTTRETPVSWSEIVFGSLLVVVLLVLAVAYGRSQWQALRRLRDDSSLPDEELRYERRKAKRRLASCALLLVMAVLLGVLLAVFGEGAQSMADRFGQEGPVAAENLPAEDRLFLRRWGGTLIAFLLALLAVLVLAALDLMETRRYGLRQYRKLQAERRAMIQRQTTRLRQERDG